MISADEYMRAAPALVGSNTAYGVRYGQEVKRIIDHAARRAPRNMQVHLGPSELGVACDGQVVRKLLREPRTNHVADPFPSIRGTALHAWAATAFDRENMYQGWRRFHTEMRVAPTDAHPGSTDLYDALEKAVVDHKFLGPTSMAKLRRKEGPPRVYRAQILLYGLGCLRQGLPVDRVMIIGYPATAASLDDLFVWEHSFGGPEDIALLREVLADTVRRKQMAEDVRRGVMKIGEVPITPEGDLCYFCLGPFYRPNASRISNEPGCPGTTVNRSLTQ